MDEGYTNISQDPGVRKYTIPRKKRLLSEDCQQEITSDSREGKDILNSINNITWEAGEMERSYTITKIFKVDNPMLEKEFQTKRSEMKDEGRSTKELAECLAFKTEYYISKVTEYCKQGMCCQGDNSILGDSKMGVSLWRCPDLCLKSLTTWPNPWTVYMVVFRVVKGRVKAVTTNQSKDTQTMEPTPNYDCHVSKNIPNQSITDVPTLMSRTQYYMYEYNEEGFPVERPRQCLPYAVIHIKKVRTPLPDIRQLMIIEETTPIETCIPEPVPQDVKQQVNVIDDTNSSVVWRGLIATNQHNLGVVAMHAGHKIGLKIWKSFLDVRNKIPLDNLVKVIPGDIRTAWTKPLSYRGYTFSLCTLKPCGPSDNFINFIKSLSIRDRSAAMVNVDSSTMLFLVPSCKLAIDLGFCAKEESWRMFCIIRKHKQTTNIGTEQILNPEATIPSNVIPENLNIGTKVLVPIPVTRLKHPPCRPVAAFNRSRSVDNPHARQEIVLPKKFNSKVVEDRPSCQAVAAFNRSRSVDNPLARQDIVLPKKFNCNVSGPGSVSVEDRPPCQAVAASNRSRSVEYPHARSDIVAPEKLNSNVTASVSAEDANHKTNQSARLRSCMRPADMSNARPEITGPGTSISRSHPPISVKDANHLPNQPDTVYKRSKSVNLPSARPESITPANFIAKSHPPIATQDANTLTNRLETVLNRSKSVDFPSVRPDSVTSVNCITKSHPPIASQHAKTLPIQQNTVLNRSKSVDFPSVRPDSVTSVNISTIGHPPISVQDAKRLASRRNTGGCNMAMSVDYHHGKTKPVEPRNTEVFDTLYHATQDKNLSKNNPNACQRSKSVEFPQSKTSLSIIKPGNTNNNSVCIPNEYPVQEANRLHTTDYLGSKPGITENPSVNTNVDQSNIAQNATKSPGILRSRAKSIDSSYSKPGITENPNVNTNADQTFTVQNTTRHPGTVRSRAKSIDSSFSKPGISEIPDKVDVAYFGQQHISRMPAPVYKRTKSADYRYPCYTGPNANHVKSGSTAACNRSGTITGSSESLNTNIGVPNTAQSGDRQTSTASIRLTSITALDNINQSNTGASHTSSITFSRAKNSVGSGHALLSGTLNESNSLSKPKKTTSLGGKKVDHYSVSKTSCEIAVDKEITSSSPALASLFHVMRSKSESIPFLEDTSDTENLGNDGHEYQNTVDADPVLIDSCSIVENAKPLDSSESFSNDLETKETFSQNAYENHRKKLVPCVKKTCFTRIQTKQDNPDDYTAMTPPDNSKESSDFNKSHVVDDNRSSHDINTTYDLKRRPSLIGQLQEFKPLHNERKTTEKRPSTVDTTIIDDGPLTKKNKCLLDSSNTEKANVTSTNTTSVYSKAQWSNGLQVIEAMLIEVEFLKLEEEVELLEIEEVFEYPEVSSISSIVEHEAVIIQCEKDGGRNLKEQYQRDSLLSDDSPSQEITRRDKFQNITGAPLCQDISLSNNDFSLTNALDALLNTKETFVKPGCSNIKSAHHSTTALLNDILTPKTPHKANSLSPDKTIISMDNKHSIEFPTANKVSSSSGQGSSHVSKEDLFNNPPVSVISMLNQVSSLQVTRASKLHTTTPFNTSYTTVTHTLDKDKSMSDRYTSNTVNTGSNQTANNNSHSGVNTSSYTPVNNRSTPMVNTITNSAAKTSNNLPINNGSNPTVNTISYPPVSISRTCSPGNNNNNIQTISSTSEQARVKTNTNQPTNTRNPQPTSTDHVGHTDNPAVYTRRHQVNNQVVNIRNGQPANTSNNFEGVVTTNNQAKHFINYQCPATTAIKNASTSSLNHAVNTSNTRTSISDSIPTTNKQVASTSSSSVNHAVNTNNTKTAIPDSIATTNKQVMNRSTSLVNHAVNTNNTRTSISDSIPTTNKQVANTSTSSVNHAVNTNNTRTSISDSIPTTNKQVASTSTSPVNHAVNTSTTKAVIPNSIPTTNKQVPSTSTSPVNHAVNTSTTKAVIPNSIPTANKVENSNTSRATKASVIEALVNIIYTKPSETLLNNTHTKPSPSTKSFLPSTLDEKENKSLHTNRAALLPPPVHLQPKGKRTFPVLNNVPGPCYPYKGSSYLYSHPPPPKMRRLIDDRPRPHLPINQYHPPRPLPGIRNSFPVRYTPYPAQCFNWRAPPYSPGFNSVYRHPLAPPYRCYGDDRNRVL